MMAIKKQRKLNEMLARLKLFKKIVRVIDL